MKKFVAFAMILSLGLFCAVGCKPAETKKVDKKPDVTKEVKEGDKAPATTPPAPDTEKDKDKPK